MYRCRPQVRITAPVAARRRRDTGRSSPPWVSGTPGFAGRALTGSASLPSLRDRLRRPPARWCGSATGDRHASILPSCRLPIRRLAVGRCAPARVWFRLIFAPCCRGGRKWPVCSSGGGCAAFACYSPSRPPAGEAGELRSEKGIAVCKDRSRWSLIGAVAAPLQRCTVTPLQRRHPAMASRRSLAPRRRCALVARSRYTLATVHRRPATAVRWCSALPLHL
jgi:hypothetical protein